MHLHLGRYRFRQRVIAFRRDSCRACAGPEVAVLRRALYVLHLWYVPLLPLGVWSRWECTACGRAPHAPRRTRRGFRIAAFGLACLGLLLTCFGVPSHNSTETLWGVRGVYAVLVVATALWWRAWRPEPDPAVGLARVPRTPPEACPVCSTRFLARVVSVCPSCGAEHRPLDRA